ncbi:putative RNA methylase [Natronocella acetinitrilica]|uniref:RNA methylase n=1 Tax=Natronocella acetinitrilica TaxID=414046 RepID=A0AAE3G4N4_9GAMM|nr:DUF4942 domain-containing protein [Natronocella acetinitrilica]MCP1674323.1 putative RNA methylase [Natronocella acetinitrilica]
MATSADVLQFYPTPAALARHAWSLFESREFIRVLEPSAGTGDLADPGRAELAGMRQAAIDCVEYDIERHAVLREKGYRVVGHDFLALRDGAIYSHIIMNPPFASGAAHVLHAWKILYHGEIVAVINAETLDNPCTRERQQLARLVADHGRVEYHDAAFLSPETQRKSAVRIALVWLNKQAASATDVLGDLLADLRRDRASAEDWAQAGDTGEAQALMLPERFIENVVLAFDASVEAAKTMILAEARFKNYRALVGKTMAEANGEAGRGVDQRDSAYVINRLNEAYGELKDRAWTAILRSTDVTSRLSSAAQKRLEAQFEDIKQMAFTESNIRGFICGLVAKQGEIQVDMACDVFDEIMRYHSDNRAYYMGWRSNDRHRTLAMRIKTTRFVLPGFQYWPFGSGLAWESRRRLADIDKVFAMLDGKLTPEVGLADLFEHHQRALANGERLQASYFDVRYYKGRGTIHFFPRSKTLVDRLNRLVGRERAWLPEDAEQAHPDFWAQYEAAEKMTKTVNAAIVERQRGHYHNLLWMAEHGQDDDRARAMELLGEAITEAVGAHGFEPETLLEANPARPRLTASR